MKLSLILKIYSKLIKNDFEIKFKNIFVGFVYSLHFRRYEIKKFIYFIIFIESLLNFDNRIKNFMRIFQILVTLQRKSNKNKLDLNERKGNFISDSGLFDDPDAQAELAIIANNNGYLETGAKEIALDALRIAKAASKVDSILEEILENSYSSSSSLDYDFSWIFGSSSSSSSSSSYSSSSTSSSTSSDSSSISEQTAVLKLQQAIGQGFQAILDLTAIVPIVSGAIFNEQEQTNLLVPESNIPEEHANRTIGREDENFPN